MSNKNVWKTNWNTNPNQNDEMGDPTTNYRSIRSTGNRYSRYAPNNDKNSTQSILQRAKLPKTHHTKQNNNGYGHNTYNQGLPFHTLLQDPQPQSIHDDDDKDLVYHREDLLKPHSNLSTIALDPSDTQPSNRFPQNTPQTSTSGDKKTQATAANPLSSTGKWRSRRAEKLKQNPHQKHPYSSKPIPSTRDYSGTAESTTHEVSSVSPTTYKDSRFTRFAQEQQQLTHNHSTTTNASTRDNTSAGASASAVRKQKAASPLEHSHSHSNSAANSATVTTVHAHTAHTHTQQQQEEEQWFYKDPSGQEQGPFIKSQMSQWFGDGYFPQDLPIRCNPATPFVQLKDWFLQGMTAFLEDIPSQWPQTNEQVIINPNVYAAANNNRRVSPPQNNNIVAEEPGGEEQDMDIESDHNNNNNANNKALPSSYTRYEHNTPPSTDNEEDIDGGGEDGTQYTTTTNRTRKKGSPYDDEENATNKSSIAGDDSFYDPSSTRMASIHPRPNTHEEVNMNMNISNDKMNMNQDEANAMDYYLQDNKNEDTRHMQNEYDYDKYNEYDYNKYNNHTEQNVNGAMDSANQRSTPPPIHPAHSYHHHPTSTNKLTPVSAYDRSLAATPPAQNPSKPPPPPLPPQANTYASSYHQPPPQPQPHHEYDEEYNYTPSTNPEHNEEEHDTMQMPLFRSNTDPTDYHHAITSNDIDMLQQSTSDPNDQNNNKNNNVYDPFGGQDLFANGRRNLTQHPAQHNRMMDRMTTPLQPAPQQQIHRKYEPGPTRQAMKRICNDNSNSNETQQTPIAMASSSISTTPSAKQQRDRKPPIRHKWPQHFMATTQMQFEQMMVKQPMNVDVMPPAAVITKPQPPPQPTMTYPTIAASQSLDGSQQSERATKKQKTRKRRKKKHHKTNANKSESNHASNANAWGRSTQGNKSKHNTQSGGARGAAAATKPSFMELQAEDEHEQQQIKRKQRENIKRRQEVIKQQKQQQLLQKQAKLLQQQAAAAQQHEANMNHTTNTNPWQQSNTAAANNNNNNNNGANSMKSSAKSKKKIKMNKDGVMMVSGAASSWSSRAKAKGIGTVHTAPIHPHSASIRRNNNNNNGAHNNGNNNNNKSRRSKQNGNKASKSNNNRNGNMLLTSYVQAGNNKNIEAVNKVSAELQSWLRTEIKKLNAEVEAASVAHLLLTLDDDTAKTTAYHTFGNGKEVNTFIDSFLVHRSHDMQQQRNNKNTSQKMNHSQQKKKKGKKTRR